MKVPIIIISPSPILHPQLLDFVKSLIEVFHYNGFISISCTQRPRPEKQGRAAEAKRRAGKNNQIAKLQEKLNKKKYEIEEQKENSWNWEEKHLLDRLKYLLNRNLRTEEDSNLVEIESIKEKIAEFKFKEIQIQKSQQEVEDSLLRAIKLNHLEEIARKKVELQRIADQRKELEKKELQNSAHLEALIEEQQRRDDQSLENLKKILNKAEHLEKALKNGDLDRENQILLAHALEEGGDHAEKQRKRMIDEIIAKKQREKQERVLELEDNIRELNEQRWQLVQKHEDLIKQRTVHQSLQARGLDFLSEMEMGKIPNIDFIKKNLEDQPVDMTENDEDAIQVFERVSSDLGEMESRVHELRAEKEKTLLKIAYSNRPYRGEEDVRILQPDINLSTYTAIKDLVYDVVDEVWNAIVMLDKNVEYIMKKKDYYLRKSKALKEKALFYSEQMVLRLISLNLVEEVLEEFCDEVADECNSLQLFSENLIMNFVAAAFIDQRGSKMTKKSLVDSLKTMYKESLNSNL